METLTEALQSIEQEIRRKYGRKMRCIAHRCDLDDLVQAIYLKAWRHRQSCRGESEKAVQAWLRVVAANVFRSTINQHLGCANRDMKRENGKSVEHYCECDPSDEPVEYRPRKSPDMIAMDRNLAVMNSLLRSRHRYAKALHAGDKLELINATNCEISCLQSLAKSDDARAHYKRLQSQRYQVAVNAGFEAGPSQVYRLAKASTTPTKTVSNSRRCIPR